MKKGEMLSKMLLIATQAHHGQFDRQGMPYILHPLKIMHYLKTNDEELQCIAIGHDFTAAVNSDDKAAIIQALKKLDAFQRKHNIKVVDIRDGGNLLNK